MSEEADLLRHIRRDIGEIKQVLTQSTPVSNGIVGGGDPGVEGQQLLLLVTAMLNELSQLRQEFHTMFYHREVAKRNNLAHAIWALRDRLVPK